MDTESLDVALSNNRISVELDTKEFYTDIWALIKAAEKIQDDADTVDLDKDLRRRCKAYFRNAGVWVEHQKRRHPRTAWCHEGRKLESGAEKLHLKFEKQFYRYALCYMHLNRYLIIARKDLEKFSRMYDEREGLKNLKVNDMTGMLLKRAYREKRLLLQKREKLVRAQAMLENLDRLFASLKKALSSVLGYVEGDRDYTAFRAALRHGDFDKARDLVEHWHENSHRLIKIGYKQGLETAQQDGQRILDLISEHQEMLTVHDGFILNKSEINLIFSFLMADEERVDKFLNKYNVPCMVYKYRSMLKLGYKLGRIGSLEGLLVLYTRLIGGMAHPIEDIPHARRYEEEVLGRTSFLLEDRFSYLTDIFDEMDMLMEQLRTMYAHTYGLQNIGSQTPS